MVIFIKVRLSLNKLHSDKKIGQSNLDCPIFYCRFFFSVCDRDRVRGHDHGDDGRGCIQRVHPLSTLLIRI